MEARPGTQRHEETRGASASEARAWVPPRKQASTRQLPGFGDKARSKGAAGVCGYDQRGTAGPTGHAALAAPPAARLLALA